MTEAPLTLRRWTRAEYDRLIDLGVFEGDNIELIGGQLVVAEPKGAYHCSAVSTAEYALRAVLPPGWIVRTQAAISLDDESEPEPDLVVVPGRPADYRYEHPACPPLVIEVSDSRLAFDRIHKGSLFARAGIQDYWIVNLVDRVVEVYRGPAADPSAVYGWHYRSVNSYTPRDVVSPLAFASIRILVADLFP